MRFAKECALVAVNDEIIAEGQLIYKDMPRLRYSGQFDLSQIPVINSATRYRADVQGYFGANKPKAIAIHPWGKLFISSGNTSLNEAEETALTKCNADFIRDHHDGPCFLYAINNDVVSPRTQTPSKVAGDKTTAVAAPPPTTPPASLARPLRHAIQPRQHQERPQRVLRAVVRIAGRRHRKTGPDQRATSATTKRLRVSPIADIMSTGIKDSKSISGFALAVSRR